MQNLNFMVGSFSYMPDSLTNLEKRIRAHKEQLRWLESLGIDFEFYRVESAWGEVANSDSELKPNLRYKPIIEGAHPCGCNRSILLDHFYETDYDWLVCLDDDRMLYPHYNPRNFFLDLGTEPFIQLAKEGSLIVCLDPIYMPFKKMNYEWEHHETHWRITHEVIHGCLQVSFIPNLKKYGYKPIFFDRVTRAQENEPPEDLKFEVDWLFENHPILKCTQLIMKEIGQTSGNGSTIYKDLEARRVVEATQGQWLTSYLKEKAPRNPELWDKKKMNSRKNPKFTRLVPRSERYIFKDTELPRK